MCEVTIVQRVTNCILQDSATDQVLLLQKPRRGWWVAPGGKMEPSETITEAVIREYREETGIVIHNPELRGVFTVIVEEAGEVLDEWMMFTFLARSYSGQLLAESPEGLLQWHPQNDIAQLPKAEGDQVFFEHILNHPELLIKRFRYSPDYELIAVE